jgi:hypothetical protein
MDELRTEIWDILYRTDEPKSVNEIAEIVHRDCDTVRLAINHHWFNCAEDRVAIAYAAPR